MKNVAKRLRLNDMLNSKVRDYSVYIKLAVKALSKEKVNNMEDYVLKLFKIN